MENKCDIQLPDMKNFHTNKKNKWKICIPEPFMNCDKIYPIQQSKVKHLIDSLKGDENVLKIVIFGSSTQNRCHIDSDVDSYIYLKNNDAPHVKNSFPFVCDIWTNYTVDTRMFEEIKKKGVVVYER